ncbi:MAG TPA: EamA family transporter [Streptosporangiaceae bacterium]|jgi:drug/metabolite transporter (DMT)-like permease
MVEIFALAAAVLYGAADFLGGAGSRRASAIAVLATTAPVGGVVMLIAALAAGGPLHLAGLGWGLAGGAAGGVGLLVLYAGLAAGPMTVVAPVTALVATVLPVGVAVAGGERPGLLVLVGGAICLVAITLVSMQGSKAGESVGEAGGACSGGGEPGGRAGEVGETAARRRASVRGLGYGVVAGVAFGLFYLFLRDAGHSGVLWPVAISRLAGTTVALSVAGLTRTRPVWWRPSRRTFTMAVTSGVLDATANICYVLATRAGLLGLAVVITSLYPGITVLLARLTLGERMRTVQRAGLVLAAVGVIMITA